MWQMNPLWGVFYVQQHVQTAAPNVIDIRRSVADQSRETSLNTEDLEDSITMVRSTKECGFPVANEMIKDIRKYIAIMSEKQQKRGLGPRSSSSQVSDETIQNHRLMGTATKLLAKSQVTSYLSPACLRQQRKEPAV